MGNEDKYVNIWDINPDKYGADSDAAEEVTEETVKEIPSGSDGTAEDVSSDDIEEVVEVEVEEVEESVLPNSDAGEDSGEQKGDEKQAEEEEEGMGDASSEPDTSEAKQVDEYEEIVQSLIDDNILDFDEEKEYDLSTEQGLKELIVETKEKAKQAGISEFKEGLGEEEAKLLSVLEKGGTADDYIKMSQQINFLDVPLEGADGTEFEKNQMYLVEDWMKVQGYEKEEIEDTINDYIESGMLKKQAGIAQKKLAKWQDNDVAGAPGWDADGYGCRIHRSISYEQVYFLPGSDRHTTNAAGHV